MDLPTRPARRAVKVLSETASHFDVRHSLIDPRDVLHVAQVIDRETRLPEWKEALEGLTPSGSEFVDDPRACGAYVRGRLDAAVEGFKDATIHSRKMDDAASDLLRELNGLVGNSFACGALLADGFGPILSKVREATEALRLVLDTPSERQLAHRRRNQTLAAKVEPEE